MEPERESLEKALFLARLLQEKGMTAEVAEGELDDAGTRSLLNAIFPAAKGVSHKSGTPISNPAEDPNLVAAVKRHFWVRIEEGNGWIDLDPSFPSAEPGKAFRGAGRLARPGRRGPGRDGQPVGRLRRQRFRRA
ncbi:MAG: hypothetical protein MZU91_10800 [Desulfosudis oleivorans]|nr:hypothetical protein [Desulfosudis oleivorans]